MWPMTAWSVFLTWAYGRTFIVEGCRFDKLKLQTWAIPKYNFEVNITNFILYDYIYLVNSIYIY